MTPPADEFAERARLLVAHVRGYGVNLHAEEWAAMRTYADHVFAAVAAEARIAALEEADATLASFIGILTTEDDAETIDACRARLRTLGKGRR